MAEPCPKCAYVRQPGDRGEAGECPSCGVYYEKYRQRQLRAPLLQAAPAMVAAPAEPLAARLLAPLFHVPERVDQTAFVGRCLALLMIVVWGGWFILQPWQSEAVLQSFLHRVNLPFHEFGHIFFRPFGEWMAYLGGSLFQCLVPLLLAGYFVYRQEQPFSAAVCLWWFGQNLIDLAPYIGDARALAMPLIGEWSDEIVAVRAYRHDWHNVLGAIGWLEYDHALARTAKLAGVLTMLLAWAWGAVLLLFQYRSLDGDVLGER